MYSKLSARQRAVVKRIRDILCYLPYSEKRKKVKEASELFGKDIYYYNDGRLPVYYTDDSEEMQIGNFTDYLVEDIVTR